MRQSLKVCQDFTRHRRVTGPRGRCGGETLGAGVSTPVVKNPAVRLAEAVTRLCDAYLEDAMQDRRIHAPTPTIRYVVRVKHQALAVQEHRSPDA